MATSDVKADTRVWLGRPCVFSGPGSHTSVSHSTSQSPGDSVPNNTRYGTSRFMQCTQGCSTIRLVLSQSPFNNGPKSFGIQPYIPRATLLPQQRQLSFCIKCPLVHDLVAWKWNDHSQKTQKHKKTTLSGLSEEGRKREVWGREREAEWEGRRGWEESCGADGHWSGLCPCYRVAFYYPGSPHCHPRSKSHSAPQFNMAWSEYFLDVHNTDLGEGTSLFLLSLFS